MRTLKLTIAAALLAFSFQAASAQVRVGVHVGTPPPPHREVIVVHRPVQRQVIVHRAPVHKVYYKKPVRHIKYVRHDRMVRRHY